MSNEWYYAHAGEAVGPFALGDLKAGLAKLPDWQNVRVWRDGLDGWQRAGDLGEFAEPAPARRPATNRQDVPARPSSRSAPAARRKKRSLGKLLAGMILLAVVIVAGVFGKYIVSTVQGLKLRHLATTVDNKLEQGIAKYFEGFEATLPKRVDDVTTLVSAKHKGATVTFGYRVDVDGSRLGDQVKAEVREIATKNICGGTRSREILDLGGAFHLDYVDKNEQPMTEVDIVKSNCA
jgi:GYF domain 2